MNGRILISMRRAVERHLNFFEWWKEQKEIHPEAKHEKKLAQLEYENLQNEVSQDLNRLKNGRYIVTDRHGWPPDRSKFVIHNTPEEAATYGSKTLKYGNYLIKNWSQFQATRPYDIISRTLAVKERLFNRYKQK